MRGYAVLMLVAACGGDGTMAGDPLDATALTPDAPAHVTGGGMCDAVVTHETPLQPASHVPQDSEIAFASNPPSSGAHYPTFTDWAVDYPVRIPRGNYLHNEEHGGVVLLYNCPDGGCADVEDSLASLGRALPQDPRCEGQINGGGAVNARWIVTPDPELPEGVQVAAATWGWTYKASCFDAETLGSFITDHYAQGGGDRTNCSPPAGSE